MASQIYSRYIPPSKKSVPIVRQIPAPILDRPDPEPSQPSLAATRQDASSTYARYVPPSKSKSQPLSAPTESSTENSSPSVTNRKRKPEAESLDALSSVKKSKKEKKEKKAVLHNGMQEAAHFDDGESAQRGSEGEKSSSERGELVPDGDADIEKKSLKEKSTESIEPTESMELEQTASEVVAPKQSKTKRKKLKGEEVPKNSVDDNAEDLRHNKLMEKRQKSLKKAQKLAQSREVPVQEDVPMPDVPIEVHDLGPLPQPEPVPELPSLPLSASLPKWLASPIRVSPTVTAQFEEIGIPEDVSKVLQQKGYEQAFAVQAAVLPLLLPGSQVDPGDILVSAATGSGKTLSYVLPMVEDLSRYSARGIRGLIVMPTRELVTQAQQVSEICASAFARGDGYTHRVKVGTAVGNETIEVERQNIMDDHLVYDTERWDADLKDANAPWSSKKIETKIFGREQSKSKIRGDVVKSRPQVDILICTPGRLVEHLKFTPGFSISHLQWLVVDEADKLLDQSFQQWLPTVMARIGQKQAVRKVILSATMTRDVGKLNHLKLVRPKLVVLDGTAHDENETRGTGHVIPLQLVESSVKVEDETVKPLYLMELMKREKIIPSTEGNPNDDSSSSGSDSDSDSSGSDDESSSEASSAISSKEITVKAITDVPHGVLVFTKSNESAVRLGRLLALLSPSISSSIRTLTATTPRASRERTIISFASGKISIIVASDLASRGLDLPNLAHVINYDVPTSIESYVHRIGRTARAGKKGHAWTLFTATEGRWFWNEIGRSDSIERANGLKMGRLTIKEDAFASQRPRYEEALETLGKEAASSKVAKT